MQNIYQAKLHGSQLVWMGRPPVWQTGQVVNVVKDDRPSTKNAAAEFEEMLERANAARGCLGKVDLETVLCKMAQFRADWAGDDRPENKPF